MTFTAKQQEQLAAPLNRAHVKPPAPGKYGDYIEGWRVIDEANRIFGFDGWTRETVEMVETNRDLKGDKWHVGYRCKARVTAGGVFKDGSGFGSGVSKQLGDAIESAIKEAETDAMKRALMTFGNPFGLALYDKSHANVAEAPTELPESDRVMLDGIEGCETTAALKEWLVKHQQAALASANATTITDAWNARKAALSAVALVTAG